MTDPLVAFQFPGAGSADQEKYIGSSFVSDCNGAIGKAYYVELINYVFSIYDKGGTLRARVDGNTFWQQAKIQQPGGPIDPRIMFIPEANQWLAVQLVMSTGILIATTNPNDFSADPSLGKWLGAQFALPGSDFPMVGYDKNGVYISVDTAVADGRAPQIILIPRSKALAYPPQVGPNDIKTIGPLDPGVYGRSLFPVIDQSGTETPVATFLGIDTVSQKDITFALISASGTIVKSGRIPVAPFQLVAQAYVKQPNIEWGKGPRFDNSNITSPPISDGSNIWLTHTIDKVDSGFQMLAVRWYRLSIDPNTRIPSLATSGEVFEHRYDHFNSSIQSFGKDDYMVISLSRSGDEGTPSNPADPKCGNIGAYAAVMRETDASPRILRIMSGQANNYMVQPPPAAGRWGDYSTISKDPTNVREFWTVNQFVKQGGDPSTSQWQNVVGVIWCPT